MDASTGDRTILSSLIISGLMLVEALMPVVKRTSLTDWPSRVTLICCAVTPANVWLFAPKTGSVGGVTPPIMLISSMMLLLSIGIVVSVSSCITVPVDAPASSITLSAAAVTSISVIAPATDILIGRLFWAPTLSLMLELVKR